MALGSDVASKGLRILFMVLVTALAASGGSATNGFNRVVDIESAAQVSTQGLSAFSGYRRQGASSLLGSGSRASMQLRVAVPEQGYYQVYAWWPQMPAGHDNAAALFHIASNNSDFSVSHDQSKYAGQWVALGQVAVFDSLQLDISARGQGDASLLLDAFRVEYLGTAASPLQMTTTALPIATNGQPYQAQLQASGGSAPYRWAALHGLPPGLSLHPDSGAIEGTPGSPGSYRLSLQLSDAAGSVSHLELALEVLQGAVLSTAPRARMAALKADEVATTSGTSLLDEVAAMPEGSWRKVNDNLFSEAWAPSALRPLNGAGNPTPSKIILAWSSFAWDHVNGNMWLYGGGHANYSGNDTYLWRSVTRRWERTSLPSEITQDSHGNWRAIDGVMAAPSSAHTYDNNVYLQIAGRYMTYGGAAYNNGGAYMLDKGDGSDRPTGPYVFDPSRADPMKVGGTTGSHVQRVAPYPDVVGGNMWLNRDLDGNLPTASLPLRFVSGSTYATVEDGYDVVYVTGVSGGTAQQLYKHTIRDIDDPTQDSWKKVGRFWEAFTAEGAGAYDADSKVYVRTANTRFTYWDLRSPGSNNRNKLFTPQDLSGGFSASKYWGLDYSPLTDAYYLWRGYSEVWRLNPPAILSPSGWTLVKESADTSPAPDNGPGTGVLGKWKFARDLNAFIGLQGSSSGEVWIYKPVGWAPPSPPSNLPPEASISAPAQDSEFSVGSDIIISVDASDPDGTVEQVDFYAGSSLLGSDTSAPWSFTWSGASVGNHLLTVIARDNEGAAAGSTGVTVTVIGNSAPTVALTSPAPGSSFIEGQTISLAADASDSDGSITSVQFFAGASLLGEDLLPPYSLDWDGAAIGSHNLVARAVDNEGAVTDSAMVDIEVISSNLAPDVTLTAPLDGATYSSTDTISLAATATDSDGSIARVDFLRDGLLLFSDTAAPYQYDWMAAPAGVHSITARAVDNEGAETLSTTASIEVSSADGSVTVVLQDGLDGYSGTRDTFLSYWHKSSSQGHRGYFKDQKARYVALFGFAIFASEGGPVPDGAIIHEANLELYKYSSYNHNYRLNRMLVSWEENQATWQHSSSGVPWSAQGAAGAGSDYASTSDATGTAEWSAGWLGFDLTGAVQDISAGAPNLGWRLGAVSGNGNQKKFRAREYSTNPLLRPKLTIRYSAEGNLKPTVALTEPASDDSYVEGETINLVAAASDPDGSVASVQFFAGATFLGEDLLPPYSLTWGDAPVGEHNLSARVFDDEGASSVSASVTITVLSDNVAPEVTLDQPLDGAEYSTDGAITLAATASDSDGSISRVDFLVNGSVLASDSSAPYRFDWVGAAAGSHTVTALAVDNEGAATSSATATINVTSPDGSITVELQQGLDGYTGSVDTYLSYWHKSTSQGHRSYIMEQKSRYVPLFRFAIFASEGGPVPDGAIIESAEFSLYKYTSYNYNYRLNRLLVSWEENQATWQQSSAGVPWASAGAAAAGVDYDATAAATASIAWSAGWLDFDLTASVQAMADGTPNHGWRLGAVSGNGNTKKFRASEYSGDTALRPRLVIRYR